ncbi:MAG TPA: hypothetical protein VMF50_10935 [Candidatus Binataceae bacterium]|nr:hypothetical protein [Candidatus Binataceae bacterium]
MIVDLKTARGIYHLDLAAQPETAGDDLILPLALARADGIERVVFRCRIERALAQGSLAPSIGRLIESVAPALERDFEIVREAALKSIRSERKLLEISLPAA